jgi:hypothetical protein
MRFNAVASFFSADFTSRGLSVRLFHRPFFSGFGTFSVGWAS